MRDYSYSELISMQEEATRRVHEMQQRARLTAEQAQRDIKAPKQIYPKPEEQKQIKLPVEIPPTKKEKPSVPKTCSNDCPVKTILNMEQSDRSLILTLLLILGGDDEITLLALLYIMS